MDPNEKIPVEHLVVDANSFLRNVKLERIGQHICTIPEVLSEIKDSATRQRLQILPYELRLTNPTPESVKKVGEFSKKTGDFPSLSAVDLKLLGLVYMLESEMCGGTDHLKTEPQIQISNKLTNYRPAQAVDPRSLAGFHIPKPSSRPSSSAKHEVDGSSITKNDDDDETQANIDRLERLALDSDQSSSGSESDADDEESDVTEEESDWITPANLDEALVKMGGDSRTLAQCQERIGVACLTTDFAMQNVLLHMGLKVVSVDGMLVKRLKTFVLRCHSCFKSTSIMTKKFCPSCGNPTLDKVSVSVNPENGSMEYHLSARKKISTKGLRYSLPAPKGGKHACNPILCEDQPMPQNRLSKKAMEAINPLEPEYTARESPFATKDVTSRSAMLGVRCMGKGAKSGNPNAGKAGKKRGGKKR